MPLLIRMVLSRLSILFIINPISGGKDKLKIPALVETYLDRTKFDPYFRITEYVGHAAELAAEAAEKDFDVIVAVGGDGTVNEIAAKVVQQRKILGVIPFGSGNGLARFLNIPMNTAAALKVINNFHIKAIDTARFNGKFFCNMAGMGFDAHISSVFAGKKSRGFAGYLKVGIREILNYKPEKYHLFIDGAEYNREAAMISIANSSQYGNNAHISPEASVTDGLLDVCIIKRLPLHKLPVLAYQMFNVKAGPSDMVEIIKGSNIRIVRDREGSIHIDGEPYIMGREIEIFIEPLSLNVICP